MWRWISKLIGQQVALRNARNASAALAQQRLEREEIEDFLAGVRRRRAGVSA